MRSAVLVVLLSTLAFACGAAGSDDGDDLGGSSSEIKGGGGCAKSREQILASVGAARREVIERGFTWLDDNVPYSQSASHEGYRTDCSGFVSMCWGLGKPGQTTSTFGGASGVVKLSSYDELVPGDALNASGHHIVLFLGWNDAAKSGICVLEQASTASDMQFRVRSTASLKGEYKPLRLAKLANDTGVKGGGPSDDEEEVAPPPKKKTSPKTPTPEDPDPVVDDPTIPGGPSTADPGFPGGPSISDPDPVGGTGSGTMSSCTPMTAIEACLAAKLIDQVQCGSVDDGCGGSVNCDLVPTLGCPQGVACKANKCQTPPAATQPTTTTPPATTAPPEKRDTPEVDKDAEKTKAAAAPASDPGDDPAGDEKDPSKTAGKDSQPKKKKESSGCSASPTGASTNGLWPALVVAFAFLRRRRAR